MEGRTPVQEVENQSNSKITDAAADVFIVKSALEKSEDKLGNI